MGKYLVIKVMSLDIRRCTLERNDTHVWTVGRSSARVETLALIEEFIPEKPYINVGCAGRASVGVMSLLYIREFTQERNRINAQSAGSAIMPKRACVGIRKFTT